jgi:hypothetical protein
MLRVGQSFNRFVNHKWLIMEDELIQDAVLSGAPLAKRAPDETAGRKVAFALALAVHVIARQC